MAYALVSAVALASLILTASAAMPLSANAESGQWQFCRGLWGFGDNQVLILGMNGKIAKISFGSGGGGKAPGSVQT